MASREYSRIIVKRSTVMGQEPTIPASNTLDKTWEVTDIFVGELFMNVADDKIWMRTNNGIKELGVISGATTQNYYTDAAYIVSGTTLGFDLAGTSGGTLAYSVDLGPILASSSGNTYVVSGAYNPASDELTLSRNDLTDIVITGLTSGGGGGSFDCTDVDNCPTVSTLVSNYDILDGNIQANTNTLTGHTADIGDLDSRVTILEGAGGVLTCANLSGCSTIQGIEERVGNNAQEILDIKQTLLPIGGGIPMDFSFAISDETTQLTTGTNKLTFYAPYNFEITNVYASLSVPSSTYATEFTVKNNGVNIMNDVITIDAVDGHSHTSEYPAMVTNGTVNQFDKITVDINNVGTGAAGAKIYIVGNKI